MSSSEEILKLKNVSYEFIPTLRLDLLQRATGGLLKFKNAPDNLANDINGSQDAVGATIYVIDKNFKILYATNLFYLTGFNFNLKERTQLIDSLTEPIVAFFDESLRVYTFQGAAPDAGSTDPTQSYSNFRHSSLVNMYNEYLRGTKLTENKRIAVLKVANHTVYGYPMNLSSSLNSSQDKMATFTMNWVVAKHTLDIPGTVSQEDLHNMITTPFQRDEEDLANFIDKLKKYIDLFAFVLSASDSYLSKQFKLTDLTNVGDVLNDLYTDLISKQIIKPYDLFLQELSNSKSLTTTAQSVGSWAKYRDKAEHSLSKLRQFLIDLQEGRGRANYE